MEKKTIKANIAIWAVIAVLLTALLIYFIYNGNGFNGFNFNSIGNSFTVQKQENIDTNNCDKISLDFSSADIFFKTTDDSKLKVIEKSNSKLSDSDKFTLTQAGNTILIKGGSRYSINIFGFGYGSKQIEVDIPKTYVKDLDVKTTSGDINFDSNVTLNNVQCEENSGDFKSENITANNISLKASSGDLKVKKVNVKEYDVIASSGDINIGGLSGSGQVQASSGDITLSYEDIGDYSNVNARSGDIKLNTPKNLSYKFNGTCTSGDINCNFDLNYKNKRGNEASGEVGSAPFKKLTVQATSGDINISRDN